MQFVTSIPPQTSVPARYLPQEPMLPDDPDRVPGRPDPVVPPQPIDPPTTTPPIELPPEPAPQPSGVSN